MKLRKLAVVTDERRMVDSDEPAGKLAIRPRGGGETGGAYGEHTFRDRPGTDNGPDGGFLIDMSQHTFAFGDRIQHAGCPEWGVGTVTRVQNLVQDGTKCQRLSARFERAGLKTVSTAVADIRPADANGTTATPPDERANEPGSATDHLEGKPLKDIFGVLPEASRDPFASLADRVKATMELYRFTPSGGSLLDWASVQTRLSDPLSRYSRAEMEQEFTRFAHERDNHLRALIREAHRSRDEAALAALKNPTKHASDAVKRFNGKR